MGTVGPVSSRGRRPTPGGGQTSAAVGPGKIASSEKQMDEEIWLDKVGTFGVGSTGYWWGQRRCTCSSSRSGDAHEVEEGIHRVASQRGAPQWLRDKVQERRMALGKLREGLGAPGVWLRSFVRSLPGGSSGACLWKPGGVSGDAPSPHGVSLLGSSSAPMGRAAGRLPRTRGCSVASAQACGGLRGWLGAKGRPSKEAPWFAAKFAKRTAPWAFTGGGTFRAIASLGLLGAQVGIMVLLSEQWFDWGIESAGRVTFGSNA